jgi:hypothetical protein
MIYYNNKKIGIDDRRMGPQSSWALPPCEVCGGVRYASTHKYDAVETIKCIPSHKIKLLFFSEGLGSSFNAQDALGGTGAESMLEIKCMKTHGL